jgi:hypothetical protein
MKTIIIWNYGFVNLKQSPREFRGDEFWWPAASMVVETAFGS